MRYILLGYLCIFLVLISLFILLSFHSGLGYVFIQWHDWQIQTNLFILLCIFLVSVLMIYGIWMGTKHLLRRYLQKYESPKSFSQLHPYERLGILWLLHAEKIEHQKIVEAYQPSFLLYPLMRARIALAQVDTVSATTWLKDQSTPLFELSELLKIDIALFEKKYANALNRLEFLSVQPLSTWLQPVEQAYQNELQEKWLQFAQQCPWWMFKTNYKMNFDATQTSLWLKALLAKASEATENDQQSLYEWYQQNKAGLPQYYVEDQICLLKLMSQYGILNKDSFIFAQEILKYRFVPEVLYIWLDKGLIDDADIAALNLQVQLWSEQYPAQPSLVFAQWHILQKLHEYDKAKQLLSLYPDDPYMSYLRLNDMLKASSQLQDNLKILMRYSGQNFKFDL